MPQNLTGKTEWQERCAREAAWDLAENVFIFRIKMNQHSFHQKIGACLRHQAFKLEEIELVVDSGASVRLSAKRT